MKVLNIDIESFSDIDLKKSGIYKYCESDKFEILLFAYSVDCGEVQVIDLANGEQIPTEVIKALNSENVLKFAFNANFERIALSRHLGKYLKPQSWKCTMVWSAMLGLPFSLEGVGKVLALEGERGEGVYIRDGCGLWIGGRREGK